MPKVTRPRHEQFVVPSLRIPERRVSGGDAGRGLFDLRQRAMALGDAELDPGGALDAGAGDLGPVMLEPFGHHDLNAMLGAGYRVPDWLRLGLQHTRNRNPRGAPAQVERDLDRRKDRVEHFRHDQAEDVKKRALSRVLAGEDLEQGVALLGGRALIDDRLQCAVALMQRARKVDHDKEAQVVEPGAAEMATLDPHTGEALAVAVCRPRIEITRTAKGAVAVLDPIAAETPLGS